MNNRLLACRITIISLVLLCLLIILEVSLIRAGEVKPAWQVEWERTLKAAEEEGRIVIAPVGGGLDNFFREIFQKRYPRIKVSVLASGGPGALGQRVLTERRAQKYLEDLYVGGSTTPVTLLYPNKAFVPIRPAFILPEVLDESKWWQGKHQYADPESRYVFIFELTARSGPIAYNTNLVRPDQVRSYWDLLNQKWKGKLVSYTPTLAGTASNGVRFFYYHLGPDFLRRLYSEMDITISPDQRLIGDWLARGKFSLALFLSFGNAITAAKQGLPLKLFPVDHFKEGASLGVYSGSLAIFDRAPHPNAAKVAVNWLLSREGQIAWMKFTSENDNDYATLREDVPEEILPAGRRLKGVQYFMTDRPELMIMKPIYELIEKARAEAARR